MSPPPLETGYHAWWSFRHALTLIGLLVLAVVLTTALGYSPVGAVLLLVVTVLLTYAAFRRRGRMGLTIDADGIHDDRRQLRQSFADAALIWVGRPHARGPAVLNPPMVVTYTRADVASARRSGSRLRPASAVEVDYRWDVAALAAELRQRVAVPVVSGAEQPRRVVQEQLRIGTDDGSPEGPGPA